MFWRPAFIYFSISSSSFLRPEATYFSKTGNRIGGVYRKALFREFTDDSFTTEKVRTAEEEHLGFLGPIIRAEVGDTIEVVFMNNASRNYSIHAEGVHYDKANEGVLYDDGSTGRLTFKCSQVFNVFFCAILYSP